MLLKVTIRLHLLLGWRHVCLAFVRRTQAIDKLGRTRLLVQWWLMVLLLPVWKAVHQCSLLGDIVARARRVLLWCCAIALRYRLGGSVGCRRRRLLLMRLLILRHCMTMGLWLGWPTDPLLLTGR